MSLSYKILGQAMTVAGSATSTTLYTVPSSKSTTVSAIIITNTSASTTTYRIAVVPSASTGSASSLQHYIAYDVSLAANSTNQIRGGITLATGDQVRIYGSTTDISVNLYGAEITG
jgi:hypothetical protein